MENTVDDNESLEVKIKKKEDDRKKYLYEIGLFVVEFENLQKAVKDFIGDCFKKEELADINLIHILLYRTQSMELTEYFRGMAYYQLSKLETYYATDTLVENKKSDLGFKKELKYRTEEDKRKFEVIRKLISKANKNLSEVATFRNDLLHATYDNSTEAFFKDDKLEFLERFQGVKSKIRSSGIELNHINIEPNVFEKVIDMMMILRYLVGHIGSIVNDKNFYDSANFSDEHLKLYEEIKIEHERTRLFETTIGSHLGDFIQQRDMKARQDFFDLYPDGNIPG